MILLKKYDIKNYYYYVDINMIHLIMVSLNDPSNLLNKIANFNGKNLFHH